MNLREAAQQALEALERYQVKRQDFDRFADEVTALRAALAEDERDWSLLEATQESLREHMAEIQRLRAALAQPAASGGPDMRHPKIQALIGGKARREIELRLVEQLLDDPDCDLSAMDMEYWHGLHDKLREKLTAATAQPAPARVPRTLTEEQLERHGISASECPPNSQVMLVSSIRRLLGYAGTPAKEAP